MLISILTPDLSHNCLGRAYLLAKILQRHYEVEVIGPIFGTGIWKPVANDRTITYKTIQLRGRLAPYWQIKELYKVIDGDVIYASKPLLTSFGLGLLKKVSNKKPLVLDIDDWQIGFIKEKCKHLSSFSYLKFLISSILFSYSKNSYWNNLLCEKLVPFADNLTVSNTFLKKKFGGTIVWHGRDTTAFDPAKFHGNHLKKKYNVSQNQKVIMFFGTPRPHKGIEDLIKSISMIKEYNVTLIIVGMDTSQYSEVLTMHLKKTLQKNFQSFGLQPFDKVPEFLAMADIVVIPQRRNFATLGQVPAKVFDAMAMEKTIITTDVSDLPEIINGCGWIVEPNRPEQFAKSIQFALTNPKESKIRAIQARKKCKEEYSWDAMEKTLTGVFRKFEI